MDISSKNIEQWDEYLDHLRYYSSNIGVSHLKLHTLKLSTFYKGCFVNLVLSVVLVRDLVSLCLNNEQVSLWLGDIAFNKKFKTIWNFMIIIVGLTTLSIR